MLHQKSIFFVFSPDGLLEHFRMCNGFHHPGQILSHGIKSGGSINQSSNMGIKLVLGFKETGTQTSDGTATRILTKICSDRDYSDTKLEKRNKQETFHSCCYSKGSSSEKK